MRLGKVLFFLLLIGVAQMLAACDAYTTYQEVMRLPPPPPPPPVRTP